MGLDFLDTLRTLAVLVAGFSAFFAVWKYRQDATAKSKLQWQKATIQALMQTAADATTFEELKTRYRSEAADLMNKSLQSKDISDQNLRVILVELCRDNVVVQMGEDQYALTTYLGQIQAMRDLNQEMLNLQKTFFEAQLQFLAKNDESIRNLIEQNKQLLEQNTRSRAGFGVAS